MSEYRELIGQKCGMTRIFTPEGVSIPVTVVAVEPNRITQIKHIETDGYNAVQVAGGQKRASRLTKSKAGQFAKASVEPGTVIKEQHLSSVEGISLGDTFTVDIFEEGQRVDVTGISKGKGFAGVVKRHNFSTQNATHGNSLTYRAPGSTGQCQTPGRVFKGKKMAGQMGNKQSTVQSLSIARVDIERNLLLIKGAVPGAPGGMVIVKHSVKAKGN